MWHKTKDNFFWPFEGPKSYLSFYAKKQKIYLKKNVFLLGNWSQDITNRDTITLIYPINKIKNDIIFQKEINLYFKKCKINDIKEYNFISIKHNSKVNFKYKINVNELKGKYKIYIDNNSNYLKLNDKCSFEFNFYEFCNQNYIQDSPLEFEIK